MVLCGRKAVFGQKLLQLVHILAGGAVDDAALAGVVAQILDDKIVLAAGALDLKVEVGPVKAGHKHLRVVEPQRADNVVLDLRVAVAVNADTMGRRGRLSMKSRIFK